VFPVAPHLVDEQARLSHLIGVSELAFRRDAGKIKQSFPAQTMRFIRGATGVA
jgi:hypothetical protein